jgi:PleD family two-component response regulator
MSGSEVVRKRLGQEQAPLEPAAQEQGLPEQAPLELADILVVDDDTINLRLLSRILAHEGYQVRMASGGTQAFQAIEARIPDLILLDIMMPDISGFKVCQRLKESEKTREIPVIFLSALGSIDDKVKAFGAGGVDYVTKPFQAREVIVRVATHLELRRLQRQLWVVNKDLESRNAELERRNLELQELLSTLKTLSGLIPICAWCGRKIEDESGQWQPVELYIEAHSEASFTHGMCPDCFEKVTDQAREALRERKVVKPSPGPNH